LFWEKSQILWREMMMLLLLQIMRQTAEARRGEQRVAVGGHISRPPERGGELVNLIGKQNRVVRQPRPWAVLAKKGLDCPWRKRETIGAAICKKVLRTEHKIFLFWLDWKSLK